MKVFSPPAACAFAVCFLFHPASTLRAEPELVPLTPPPPPAPSAPAVVGSPSIAAKPGTVAQALPSTTLAKFLPNPLPDWLINEKTGNDAPLNGVPASTARRFYAANSDPQGEKMGVELAISDWINLPDQLRMRIRLWSFTNDSDETGYQRGQIVAGFPAEETWDVQEKEHVVTMIVGGRYLLKLKTLNVPVESLMKWLNQVDLKTLSETKP